jgi:hypothetical protein
MELNNILNQKWFSRSRQFLTVVNYCVSDSWKLSATYFCRKPKLTEYSWLNIEKGNCKVISLIQ